MQLKPAGMSETLQIVGRTVSGGYQRLAAMVHSPERLQEELWDRFSREKMATVEKIAYERMRRVVCAYLEDE